MSVGGSSVSRHPGSDVGDPRVNNPKNQVTINGEPSPSSLYAYMQKQGKKPRGYIFRAWITRNGVRVYAKDYGHKAWRIPIYR